MVERAYVLGPRAAIDDLAGFFSSNREARQSCHGLSHVVGAAMFAEFEWDAVFGDASWCNWGYYHGLLVEAAYASTDLPELGTRLCTRISLSGTPRLECLHGIGHAAYQLSGDLRESFTACYTLAEEASYTCADGVVMEARSQMGYEHFREQEFTTENCLELADPYLVGGCARGMATLLFDLDYSLEDSCGVFKEQLSASRCAEGYGSQAATKILESPEYSRQNVESCMRNAQCAYSVGTMVYYETYDLSTAEAVCAMLADAVGTSRCLKGVNYAYSTGITPDEGAGSPA